MSKYITVNVNLKIWNEAELRQAAQAHALKDNGDETFAKSFLDPEQTSVGDCAVQLIDPGTLPGVSIDSSDYESYSA
ncbi:MAG: hypothetical protein E6R08_10155 [Nevskiaceae bacterium]|nr:MAG: hypothetical protein E6R08_10155 [Nevskiaceae bacterium]